MIEETFVAINPKEAYKLVIEKYDTKLRVISARQIKTEDNSLRSEIKVAVPQNLFFQKSMIEEELLDDDINIRKEVREIFIQRGISGDWIDSICVSLMGSPILKDKEKLISFILEEIDDLIEIKLDTKLPKILIVVGTTGIGKTTTISKLAYMYRSSKIALINLDKYKMGAFGQLDYYAKEFDVPHKKVENRYEFKEALKEFEDFDTILVDTGGLSPYDNEKFVEMLSILDIKGEIEIHLAIPATIKDEDIDRVYREFSPFNISGIIVTKFDETRNYGSILNLIISHKVPLSYFCNGQDIKKDIVVASKEYIFDKFIKQFEE